MTEAVVSMMVVVRLTQLGSDCGQCHAIPSRPEVEAFDVVKVSS